MISNNPGHGHYGSLPTTTAQNDVQVQNGGAHEETTTSFPGFASNSMYEMYKKEIDWTMVTSTGRILMIASIFALAIAIGILAGASYACTVSLAVISACIFASFSRQLFLLFLLSVAGVSTVRTKYYRTRKFQLLVSMCATLVSFLIMGGALYLAIHRLVKNDHFVVKPAPFLCVSVVALPFLAILCGLLSKARNLEDQRAIEKKGNSASKKAALVSGFSRFSKERGLILRRTLNRISIRANHHLSLALLVQALVAFIAALIAYFKPYTAISDSILAILFSPLAIVMTISVIWDMISVMTEGILQGVDFAEIAEALISIEGVTAVRHLRIWSMKTDEVSLSVQIAIDDQANFDTVLRNANELLKTKYDIYQYKIDSVNEPDEDIDM